MRIDNHMGGHRPPPPKKNVLRASGDQVINQSEGLLPAHAQKYQQSDSEHEGNENPRQYVHMHRKIEQAAMVLSSKGDL